MNNKERLEYYQNETQNLATFGLILMVALALTVGVFIGFYMHFTTYECEQEIQIMSTDGSALDEEKAKSFCDSWAISFIQSLPIYSTAQ